MRRILAILFCCAGIVMSTHAFAMLSMELTRGVAGAVPIAIVPFTVEGGTPPQDVSGIISHDLQNSGRFKVYTGQSVSRDMPMRYFRSIGADHLVLGKVQHLGGDHYQVSVELYEVFKGSDSKTKPSAILNKTFTVTGSELRALSHHISDLIYQQITGIRGVFSTKLAYIVVQRPPGQAPRYRLEVSDQDGYNPKPLLNSTAPIMSPAWSPNGRQIAYVTFEKKHASIYVQDVATGYRQLLTDFPGINGAPAWSPDGRKLALVLSKGGTPNIYTMDIVTHQLTQLTRDWSINTEPDWSPSGRSIIFTSNRSGGPQIYEYHFATNSVTRITYDGNYNARASFTPDGKCIVMLNRQSNLFNIGLLDLDTGTFRVLTNSGNDNESPSMAPNGNMVLYGTLYGGRGVLGMVANDSSVEIRLPARDGEVQDPAWSPFLS